MAWRRRVLREEAVMERSLTQSALAATRPAVGTWGRNKGYSTKAQRGPSQREGQTQPIGPGASGTFPKSRYGNRSRAGTAPVTVGRSQTPAATVRQMQNLSGGDGRGPFHVNRDMMAPERSARENRTLPAGSRADTPVASRKVSDWMSRGPQQRSASRSHYDNDDARSTFSAASYSSGTSIQSYSDCTERSRSGGGLLGPLEPQVLALRMHDLRA
eukprot:CAMPEP_0173063752 /NCGR_PEP_ID=MMETSP1102-20130122/4573_1 /TAXON_ID=49646 /ORGANISM="Geminigera sp., Strain Caron Lab Isolate" /LENGTH=214 /DNA_ID=CAMNT_0013930619 /DNA_START=97 /DNA_END=741 /DNA_ORIENTATION=-